MLIGLIAGFFQMLMNVSAADVQNDIGRVGCRCCKLIANNELQKN